MQLDIENSSSQGTWQYIEFALGKPIWLLLCPSRLKDEYWTLNPKP